MSNKSERILIIDDHRLFADGLSLVLSQGGYEVSTFYNARSVLDDDNALNTHNLALIDLNMPALDGFGFIKGIISRRLAIKVIVISATDNRADIQRIMQLGAKGFLSKDTPSMMMLKAIKQVLAGGTVVPPGIEFELQSESDKTQTELTQRQLEILQLMHDGYANKEIAQVLNVTESTVKSHIQLLFKALGAKNRTDCVKKGQEKEYI